MRLAISSAHRSPYRSTTCHTTCRGLRPWQAGLALISLTISLHTSALTLEAAVKHGLSMHPKVAAAEAQFRASAVDVDIAKDGYWPNIQASAGPENAIWGDFGWNLTATQMLLDWGRVRAQVEQATAKQREHYQNLKATTEEAALDIIEVYLDVLLYEARLEAVDLHIGRLNSLAEMTRDRGANGYTDRAEQERVMLELRRAEEQRDIERGALSEAQSSFRELLAMPSVGLDWPSPEAFALQFRNRQTQVKALVDAPRYQQALAQVEQAQAQRDESKAALKPRLNLEGSLLRRNIGGQMASDSVLSLTVRMDAMQGLSSFRRVSAAESREQAAQWNQQATRLDLSRELSASSERDRVLDGRLASLSGQLANVQEVATVYREQFEIGNRSIDDLLPIQKELFEAERLEAELRSEKIRVQYRVASLLGRLGELLD